MWMRKRPGARFVFANAGVAARLNKKKIAKSTAQTGKEGLQLETIDIVAQTQMLLDTCGNDTLCHSANFDAVRYMFIMVFCMCV
jgi:hypothetical protein